MTHPRAFVAMALAMFLFVMPSLTAAEHAVEEQARAAYAQAIKDYDIPGLVVGVTRHGKHAFYATGWASRADLRPVTPDTLFELGSISKIFNVTLAALAEQKGQLSLDAPAADFLCHRPCSLGNDLTLMDLATHYSGGLPLQVPEDVDSTEALVRWLDAWTPPAPGTRSYSNVSIGLLGHIAAGAMGMSYTQAVQGVLLPQLGLNSTWVEVPEADMSRYAFGYERKTDKPIRVTPGVLAAEAYGVKSTARDMLLFLDSVLERRNTTPDVNAAIRRTLQGQLRTAKFTQAMIWEQYPWPANLETMTSANGYDFILTPQPATRIRPALAPQDAVILNKTGSTNGFGGYVAVLPSQGLGIVMLANRNFPNEARIAATYTLINAILQND